MCIFSFLANVRKWYSNLPVIWYLSILNSYTVGKICNENLLKFTIFIKLLKKLWCTHFTHHTVVLPVSVSALPILLHADAIALEESWICKSINACVYWYIHTHQSSVSPRKTPMQELKWKCFVQTLCWVCLRVVVMQLAHPTVTRQITEILLFVDVLSWWL